MLPYSTPLCMPAAFAEELLGAPRDVRERAADRAERFPAVAIPTYSLRDDGVAVLQVRGVLCNGSALPARFRGDSTVEGVLADIERARRDPRARAVVLAIDSEGGEASGARTVADAVFALGCEKPVLAHARGPMLGAAFVIATAADVVYVQDEGVRVGGLDVVAAFSRGSGRLGQGAALRLVEGRHVLDGVPGSGGLQMACDREYAALAEILARNLGRPLRDVLRLVRGPRGGREFSGREAVDLGIVTGTACAAETLSRARGLAECNA